MAKAQRVAELNFSDIPEMLPGARPGATAAQRVAFERRGCMLHWEDLEEHTQTLARVQVDAGRGDSTKAMEDMFPKLDGALVRSILAESPSAQHALDTLLALTASAEPLGVSEVDATGEPKHPMREVVLDDHDTFPSLVDADGWQCVSGAKLQEMEKDPGSTWCDRASAAKDKPAPKAKAAPVTWVRKKRPGQQKVEEELEQTRPYTDYECRHRAGECRAKQRVKYSRGAGAGLSGCGGGRDAGGDIVPKKTRKSSTHPMCER